MEKLVVQRTSKDEEIFRMSTSTEGIHYVVGGVGSHGGAMLAVSKQEEIITDNGVVHPKALVQMVNREGYYLNPATYALVVMDFLERKYSHGKTLSANFFMSLYYHADMDTSKFPNADDFPTDEELLTAYDRFKTTNLPYTEP